ncbi:head-tail connector protein [Clostridium tyrobutyricum]|uniref:head-tail connector protein n=1 Tax=Clostridium tyrobutyricum TaxID=1519 RepID=UPI002010CB72|nr:head-tail connector protein [Clostridium tyrobutyricum]MBR9648598.1 phage gp6-like head-tail connector protein [Clostridium tyrobutyricum]
MVISLEEAKLYLRVEGDEEDTLITDFITASEEICEGILRYPLSELDTVPDTVKQTVLVAAANMYEKRESFEVKEILGIMTRLLFSYRKESW